MSSLLLISKLAQQSFKQDGSRTFRRDSSGWLERVDQVDDKPSLISPSLQDGAGWQPGSRRIDGKAKIDIPRSVAANVEAVWDGSSDSTKMILGSLLAGGVAWQAYRKLKPKPRPRRFYPNIFSGKYAQSMDAVSVAEMQKRLSQLEIQEAARRGVAEQQDNFSRSMTGMWGGAALGAVLDKRYLPYDQNEVNMARKRRALMSDMRGTMNAINSMNRRASEASNGAWNDEMYARQDTAKSLEKRIAELKKGTPSRLTTTKGLRGGLAGGGAGLAMAAIINAGISKAGRARGLSGIDIKNIKTASNEL